MDDDETRRLLDAINADKPRVARAVAAAMFGKLGLVRAALDGRHALEADGAELAFMPRRELFAREGTSDKWVQQVAGYYFAESRLQRVRFTAGSGVDDAVSFTFYLDASEPLNSDDPRRIVNPEVITCRLAA